LDADRGSLDVGRNAGNAVSLPFDTSVSGRHARLIHGAGVWSVADIGSTNGTLLNGKPLVGERRLRHGAEIIVGETVITFQDPVAGADPTMQQAPAARRLFPTRTQRKVLVELARPWFEGDARHPEPPTNTEIAQRLSYQLSTVRDTISDLYKMAGLARGTTSQRAALVQLVLEERVVTALDYSGDT
jgi:pSer/pThr/pTyr-binding forkhead associated (FHA) protein